MGHRDAAPGVGWELPGCAGWAPGVGGGHLGCCRYRAPGAAGQGEVPGHHRGPYAPDPGSGLRSGFGSVFAVFGFGSTVGSGLDHMWGRAWIWVWIGIHIWFCIWSWIPICIWICIWNTHPLQRMEVACPTPAPRSSSIPRARTAPSRHGVLTTRGCCPLSRAVWGALGESRGLQQPWQEPWPPPSRGEGQNGSGPAGLGCCSAVRLGLNVLQGGAEVREGDECRKHIKRGKLAAASTAA